MLGFASAYRQRKERRQLEKVLADVELPSFPQIVQEMMAALRDPQSTSRQLGRLVSRDPALSVAVLRTVNSAAFAVRSRIVDLEQAVTLIGRANVESILVSVGVGRSLRAAGVSELRGFWRAAARRALIARAITNVVQPAEQTLAYTSALLSDVAIPLLSTHLPAHGELVDGWRAGDIDDLCAAERDRFGWDHAELGGWLCTSWGLPQALTDAIGQHHLAPDAEPVSPVAAVVRSVAFIGEPLAHALDDDEQQALTEHLQALLATLPGIEGPTVARLVDEALERADELAPTLAG
jgi:HD-like signal output (HDOD) protein